MKRLSILCLMIILSSCNNTPANSSDYILYQLNQGFQGRPANNFFDEYGFPMSEINRANGAVTYRWSSEQSSRPVAGAQGRGRFTNEDSVRLADTYHGKTIRQYCELRIFANNADIIQGFAIAIDSIGKWTTSRCSEIFDKTYPSQQ